jgi:hypothetical protein
VCAHTKAYTTFTRQRTKDLQTGWSGGIELAKIAPIMKFEHRDCHATAITFTHKGWQYVSIASGMGGILARRAVGGKVPTGGSLWTFALLPE